MLFVDNTTHKCQKKIDKSTKVCYNYVCLVNLIGNFYYGKI